MEKELQAVNKQLVFVLDKINEVTQKQIEINQELSLIHLIEDKELYAFKKKSLEADKEFINNFLSAC